MSYDLLLGRRCRNWGRGWVVGEVPTPEPSAPSHNQVLEQILSEGPPSEDQEARFPTVKEKIQQAIPTATKFYKEYQPRYNGRLVTLKLKI